MEIFTALTRNQYIFEALQNRLLTPLSQTLKDMELLNSKPGVYAVC